jgi:sugar porter (SP) family MFS transporter
MREQAQKADAMSFKAGAGITTRAKSFARLYFLALVAALGGFLFGYDLSIISGAILFIKSQFHLTPVEMGFAMSSASIGCLFGPLAGSTLADRYGRRKTLAFAAVLFGIGSLGTVWPRDMLTFNLFRMLGGVGVGVASVISPMYITEIAPSRMRGRLVTVNQLAIVIGSLISIIISYLLSFSGSWRWMLGSECFPVAAFLLGLALVPESPRWLVQKGREQEALAILKQLDDVDHANSEFRNILAFRSERQGRFVDLLRPGMRMALLVAIMLALFQQITGVSTLILYNPMIFQKAGFTRASDALLQSVIVATWNVLCTLAAFSLVDRLGRRPLLLTGTIGMSLSLLTMGILFHRNTGGIAILIVMMLAVGSYVISLAPLAWLMMSELFPTELRGRAMAIASAVLWGATFIANQMFPPMIAALEHRLGNTAGVFWLFSLITFVAVLFCWKFVPETKGRSLEEISRLWMPVKTREL